VPPYVRDRIEELASYVDDARIRVVSPKIESHWTKNAWSTVLPSLSPDRRIGESADIFADELARGWLRRLLTELETPQCDWVRACHDAFGTLTAVEALRWLRQAANGWAVGQSVVRSAEAPAALKAAAILGKQEAINSSVLPSVKFETRAGVRIGDQRVDILLAGPNQPTGQLKRLARR
jgi:hypothetical protein